MAATHPPAHSIVQSWLTLSWCPLGVVRDRNTMDQQKLKHAGTFTVDFIAHDFWKVLMHEWHRRQQIINRILSLITSCLISKAVRPGITGWSLAGTAMATRVGLLTATGSFHSFQKTKISWWYEVPINPHGGLAINFLKRQIIVSKLSQIPKLPTNKMPNRPRVASTLPIVQGWSGFEWGTYSTMSHP